MKDLLKQAFQAGRDFGHAMGTGKPTYGLTFDEWYSGNENQALSIANVVGRSEQLVNKYRCILMAEDTDCGEEINYVHQLQNLYFALTGEELTIKQEEL